MFELSILERFLAALALGALIGLEREYATYKNRGHSFAGIRTFPLIALFGALATYLGQTISEWVLFISIALMGILIIVAYFTFSGHSKQYVGATSEVAGFLAFFIGMLCYNNEITLAVILAIVITIILYARSVLHRFAQKISTEEMADTLKFAVIAFVILPLLPNQGYGPYEIFNPYIIWLMVVLVSGISFVGYVALKWLGDKGIALAGLLGGLASSTALTMSFSQRSKRELKIYRALALGVILANGVMMIRVFVLVFVVNQPLSSKVLLPLTILILLTALFSYFLWRKTQNIESKVELHSPFTLTPALKFGAVFAVMLALAKLANVFFSNKGVYVVSIISGFADVDAIVISLSELAKTTLSGDIAAQGIILAVLTNICTKGGIAYFFGGKQFAKIIIWFYVILFALGLALIFLL